MSFNLYLAGGQGVPITLTHDDCVGLLTTYADGPKAVRKLIDTKQCRIFCDSGAYAAAHSGKFIDIDAYIDFINNTPECEMFAVLDEIPWPEKTAETAVISAENTWKNYIYMLEHVKPEYRDKLVCTYHYSEDTRFLKRLLNGYEGYMPKIIAFGGRAGVHTDKLYRSLDNYFWPTVKSSNNPDVKVHAFGVTVIDMLERYPWYSADSTTWVKNAINGHILSRHKKGIVNVSDRRKDDGNHFLKYPKALLDVIMEEITSRGFTYEELVFDDKKRQLWNCLYYKEWAENFVYKPKVRLQKQTLI